MAYINENYINLNSNYLFSTISKKIKEFREKNPNSKVINLGIGDVTKPINKYSIIAMNKAVKELSSEKTFKGYGPEQGYEFLKSKIIEYDYAKKNIDILLDEVFISDGTKSDISGILDIFSKKNKIAIPNPTYPVYFDSNILKGNGGKYLKETRSYENIYYLNCNENNNFIPDIPEQKIDIIYICNPNNPTGVTFTKEHLEAFVSYALKNNSIILYDNAYEAFIQEKNIPHSIYEIKDAKKVAIEFRSYSKTAGFTGIRCSYFIVPKQLKIYFKGKPTLLNDLCKRRQSTYFNGASYISQKAAASIYSNKAQNIIQSNISYYMKNAKILNKFLKSKNIKTYGAINSPYIWMKIPSEIDDWEFFDILLNKYSIVGTPGIGFGSNGKGYFRFTAFGKKQDYIKAISLLSDYFD